MPKRKQIGFVILFAGFLALLALILVIGVVPQQVSLKLAQWTVRARFPDVRSISTTQLANWLSDSNREAPVLLDVRTEDEFNVSHLPDAVREASPETIASGRPIVAYCSIGWRSAESVLRLAHDGHTNVLNLEGSIFVWASEGRPLESHGQPIRKVHPYDSKWGRLLPSALRSDRADIGDEAMARARPLRWLTGPLLLFLLLWWETLTPFLPLFQSGWRKRALHGLRNITMALLNSGMTALLFVGLWAMAANWAEHNGFGLLTWIGAPPLWHALAAVMALDFWTYCWHRLNHRVPFLWRFHRAHHSDAQMDVTTASRFHIGEILFSNSLRIPLILLFGIHLWEMVFYETALLAVNQFQHANIGLPRKMDQLLRCFIVTPAMHKVHHSRWQPETDSNYSSLLSVWDRIFRSFRLRDDPRTIQFGLDDFAAPSHETLSGILKTPLNQGTRPKPLATLRAHRVLEQQFTANFPQTTASWSFPFRITSYLVENQQTAISHPVMSEQPDSPGKPATNRVRVAFRILLLLAALIVAGVLVWQGVTSGGNPDPTAPNTSPTAALLNIAVLVFREGLECILVLSAITASMTGNKQAHRRPVMAGAGIAFIATLITWFIAVGIVSNLTGSVSALNLQAATGLLAVIVLLVIMNWFFHKIYWGGWMTMHNRRKKNLIESASDPEISKASLLWGLGLLGFTSLYREGFEVVLFLQSYYLRMGGKAVLGGALLGLFFTGIVAVLTFVAHRKLPYRKMLILTGVMLGVVLLVMVGEQAQEMQLAHWIPTTEISSLTNVIPPWMGLWFAIFPTRETLAAQALAAILVIGSYYLARGKTAPPCQDEASVILGHAADCPMAAKDMRQSKLNQCPQCGMKLVKKP